MSAPTATGVLLMLPSLALGLLQGACAPLINDISTDRESPPVYLVEPPADPAYDKARLVAPTERAYGDLRNLALDAPPARVFEAVRALVAARGWRVAAEDAAARRVQAVAVTRRLRFRDDVVIEVRPRPGGGSVVAMRSKSRVGKGDLGANARRIRAFLADLRARLDG